MSDVVDTDLQPPQEPDPGTATDNTDQPYGLSQAPPEQDTTPPPLLTRPVDLGKYVQDNAQDAVRAVEDQHQSLINNWSNNLIDLPNDQLDALFNWQATKYPIGPQLTKARVAFEKAMELQNLPGTIAGAAKTIGGLAATGYQAGKEMIESPEAGRAFDAAVGKGAGSVVGFGADTLSGLGSMLGGDRAQMLRQAAEAHRDLAAQNTATETALGASPDQFPATTEIGTMVGQTPAFAMAEPLLGPLAQGFAQGTARAADALIEAAPGTIGRTIKISTGGVKPAAQAVSQGVGMAMKGVPFGGLVSAPVKGIVKGIIEAPVDGLNKVADTLIAGNGSNVAEGVSQGLGASADRMNLQLKALTDDPDVLKTAGAANMKDAMGNPLWTTDELNQYTGLTNKPAVLARTIQDAQAEILGKKKLWDGLIGVNKLLSDSAKLGVSTFLNAVPTSAGMAALSAAQAQPQDIEQATQQGAEMGLGFGIPAGVGLSSLGFKANAISDLRELGRQNVITPDNPMYGHDKTARDILRQTPEGRAKLEIINQVQGISTPLNQQYVALTPDAYVDMLKENNQFQQNAPNAHVDGNTTFFNIDAPVDSLFHELIHPLEGSIGERALAAAFANAGSDPAELEKVGQFIDRYDAAMRHDNPAYAGLSPDKAIGEIAAEIGRDILKNNAPHEFYGGKDSFTAIGDSIRKFLKNATGTAPEPGTISGSLQAPDIGGIRDVVESMLYDLGQKAKQGIKYPSGQGFQEPGASVPPEVQKMILKTGVNIDPSFVQQAVKELGANEKPDNIIARAFDLKNAGVAKPSSASIKPPGEKPPAPEPEDKGIHPSPPRVTAPAVKLKSGEEVYGATHKEALDHAKEQGLDVSGAEMGYKVEKGPNATFLPLQQALEYGQGTGQFPDEWTIGHLRDSSNFWGNEIEHPDGQQFMPSDPGAQQSARDYVKKSGIGAIIPSSTAKVNVAHAKQIAQDFEKMPSVDTSSATKASYAAFSKEVNDQFNHALQDGYKFDFTPDNPYKTSAEMMADVANKKLKVYTGGSDHPFTGSSTTDENGLTVNDKFRAVHDLYGHASEGNQFGPQGEERAWLKHSAMFSDEAKPAMTSETRGQNSWVNFGPHMFDESGYRGDKSHPDYLSPQDRPYAEQKAALLPDHANHYVNPETSRTGSGGAWDSTFVDGEGEKQRLELAPKVGANPDKFFAEQTPEVRKAITDHFKGTGEAQYMPSTHPDALNSAAVQDDNGRVFTSRVHAAPTHMEIHDEHEGLIKYPYTDGFVTNKGEFLNRSDALDRAVKMKQMSQYDADTQRELANEQGLLHSTDPIFDNNQYMPSEAPKSGFYSQLEQSVESMPDFKPIAGRVFPSREIRDKSGNLIKSIPERHEPDKSVKSQILSYLESKGVKPAELEWNSPFRDALDSGASKDKLLEAARAGTPALKEKVLGEPRDLDLNSEALRMYKKPYSQLDNFQMSQVRKSAIRKTPNQEPPQYGNESLNLPGGENYRELLFHFKHPEPESGLTTAEQGRFGDLLRERYGIGYREGLETRNAISGETGELAALRAKHEAGLRTPQSFRSGHYNELGEHLAATARVDDRTDPVTGGKMLFGQEFQSDWASKIAKEGVNNPNAPRNFKIEEGDAVALGHTRSDESGKVYRIVSNDGHAQTGWFGTRSIAQSRMDEMEGRDKGIPNMPLKGGAWKRYVMRNLIKHAVDEGYDSIGWTTGQQQADRYDLSKHVDEIIWNKDSKRLLALKDGNQVMSHWDVTQDNLSDYIGKEAAQKILSQENPNRTTPQDIRTLTGTDLKVGGESKKTLYDKDLVALANDLGKPYGAKVGDDKLGGYTVKHLANDYATVVAPDGNIIGGYYPKDAIERAAELNQEEEIPIVHRFPITDQMRADVESKGQPLFMPSSHPEAINTQEPAAIQTPDGEYHTGTSHAMAYANMTGKYSPEQLGKWNQQYGEDNYFKGNLYQLNNGNIVDEQTAHDNALKYKQMTQRDIDRMQAQQQRAKLRVRPMESMSLRAAENKPGDLASRYMPSWVPDDIRQYITPDEEHVLDHTQRSLERFMSLWENRPSIERGIEMAKLGAGQRMWYDHAAEQIANIFGKDANRFSALLASLSANTAVEPNMEMALHVWDEWMKQGRPGVDRATSKEEIKSIIDTGIANAMQSLKEEGRSRFATNSGASSYLNNVYRSLTAPDASPSALKLSGPKVGSFFPNLTQSMDHLREVTNDRHIAKFMTGDPTAASRIYGTRVRSNMLTKTPEYIATSMHIRQIADRLTQETGETWTPRQVQAAIWSQVLAEHGRGPAAKGVNVHDAPGFAERLKRYGAPPF